MIGRMPTRAKKIISIGRSPPVEDPPEDPAVSQFSLQPDPWQLQYCSSVPPWLFNVWHLNRSSQGVIVQPRSIVTTSPFAEVAVIFFSNICVFPINCIYLAIKEMHHTHTFWFDTPALGCVDVLDCSCLTFADEAPSMSWSASHL